MSGGINWGIVLQHRGREVDGRHQLGCVATWQRTLQGVLLLYMWHIATVHVPIASILYSM